jgi:hypothetical protein
MTRGREWQQGMSEGRSPVAGVLLRANHSQTGGVAHMSCIPLMMSLLSDISRMPRDRDIVIGHKVSSPESLGSSEP